MDKSRYLEWVRASRSLGRIHTMLLDLANGLGMVDARLVEKDRDLCSMFEGIRGRIETPLELEHRTLSLLWVLGAYELVRTLSQRVRDNPTLLSEKAAPALSSLKLILERLRIPIAKLERARQGPDDDYAVAFPVLDGTRGVAWVIGPGDHISRKTVADELLQVLRLIQQGMTVHG